MNIPAIAALIKLEQVAAIRVLTPYFAMKLVRDGQSVPKPPISIPMEARLANPQRAKLIMTLVFSVNTGRPVAITVSASFR